MFLCIGASLVPAITAHIRTKTSSRELVDITIDFCGVEEANSRTISFAREQAEHLEVLIDDIEKKLETVESTEEILDVFNDALESLMVLSLLDDSEAKVLKNYFSDIAESNSNMHLNTSFIEDTNNHSGLRNFLCFVAGKTIATYFINSAGYVINVIGGFLEFIGLWILSAPLVPLYYLCTWISVFNPFPIGHVVGLGNTYYDAEGWIHTFGLKGKQSVNGSFYGGYNMVLIPLAWVTGYYPGILGFSGIKITDDLDHFFYLGFALGVNIGDEPILD
jgi:hypothetical protein